jgi:plasmid stability protein
MTLTIELPDELEAALKAQAYAQGVSADGFVRQVLQQALIEGKDQPSKPKKSAYGILAQYGPDPSGEEIDENRREMFRGFAEEAT